MKKLSTLSRGIIIQIKLPFIVFACLSVFSTKAQVTVAFQGAEPGDTWAYTTNGIGASAAAECMASPNIKTGTRSIGVGGNTGGGNCWSGGTGNGSSLAHTITFNNTSIATSSAYTRTLSFSWGNRFPACSGTGWDSGENLTFRAYHDGIAQPQITIVNGSNNAAYSIQSNQYTWSIPPCVQDFYFVVSVTTNRNDELLFVDDVAITSPALNPTINQPSAIMGNTLVCQGNAATYSVTNVPGTAYAWSNLPAGASFTSVNNSVNSYSINVNWGTAAPGTYSLLVTPSDACGLAPGTAQTVEVTVQPPSVPLSITGPNSICPGNTITLSSNYGSGNAWSTGANTPSISVTSAGVYSLTALTACGALNASYTVNANPPANAAITTNGPTTFCQGNSVILTSASTSGNSWSTGATTPSIAVTTSGTYSLNVTTLCGTDASTIAVTVIPNTITPTITASGPTTFCQGGSVVLTSGSTSGNSWSTGATTSSITVNTAGIYTLTVSNACASASATQSIAVTPSVTAAITASGPTTFCQGSSVILSSNAAAGNSWSTGATTSTISVNTAGIYILTVAAACGTATATQQIIVNPLPTANISFTSTTICPGDSVLLTASGGTSYIWSNGQTSAGIYANSPGTYTVRCTNACGTTTAQPVTITQLALPIVQITGGGRICAGDSLLLSASGGTGYIWSTGSTASSIYVHTTGNYNVTTANSCGISTASAQVNVSTVSAEFNASVVTGPSPLNVQFINASSTNTSSVNWNFGDSSGSTDNNPLHTFNNPGVYTITLTAQSTEGCLDTYTLTVTVLSENSSIQVPNVFTPNNDRVNDYFEVRTEGISEFHLSIFDRWGKLVMESTDPSKGWDGKNTAGVEAADGTYFYIILAKGTDQKEYNQKGTVNLFR